ncbi:hypothetical protein DPMN_031015 [Dreissena polymorpha]|uniref:Uncharacterized protein n=1 Tax=Dreissena polymorpha TaxID=45954 RepID=A0A9D4M049_DREPO|nr:hypothetical protein DPMN_031015 [Dreissena polymorpha]
MHAKYQVPIFNIAKVIANVKGGPNQPTNRPTNQQTGQKQYVPHYHNINETNVLTKFHDDWAIIVTSRVFTRNTAPPPGGHLYANLPGHKNILTNLHEDWASNVTSIVFTSFELSRGINGTNVLTKFHEDRTINVASRVFTRQNVDGARCTTDDGQKALTKAHHEHIVLR